MFICSSPKEESTTLSTEIRNTKRRITLFRMSATVCCFGSLMSIPPIMRNSTPTRTVKAVRG